MRTTILAGIFILVILAGAVFVFLQATKTPGETSGELTQGVKLGKTHTATTDQGKVVVGDPTDTKEEMIKPQIELSKWSEEVKLKVNYDIKAKEVVTEDNAIVWKGDKQDLVYKQLPAKKETALNKIPKPKIKLAQNSNTIRYVNFGETNLKTLAASYELFEKTDASTPTIISFIPNEEGYLFFGDRKADIDLKNIDTIPYPIVRVKTDNAFSCPVALSNDNGLFLVMYYAPDIERDGENIKNQFTKSINDVFKKHNIDTEIQRHGDFFYYIKDLQIKPVGRIAYDKNILIFNIYINSPYESGLKNYMRTTLQKVRDEYLLPVGGISELNPDVKPEIVDEVIKDFANTTNKSLNPDTLNSLEQSTLNSLINISNNKDWEKDAKRSDIPYVGEEEKFDRFEFDVILHEKPENNVFTYQIETEGLDFFYQPELTEEEKDAGNFRPENIIGSYAVYKKDATNTHPNNVDAEKYKIGKVMHIYRPLIKDAKGATTWGQLSVDTKKSTLSVTVDTNWLQNASYPVLIDPTFGYTSAGGSTLNMDGGTVGGLFTNESEGMVTSITAYMRGRDDSEYVFGLIRHNPYGNVIPLSELGVFQTADITTWYTLNTASTAVTGTDYLILATINDNKSNPSYIYYDTGSGQYAYTTSWSYNFIVDNGGFWPNFSGTPPNTGMVSIYATYLETGTKTNLKGDINLKGNVKLQ